MFLDGVRDLIIKNSITLLWLGGIMKWMNRFPQFDFIYLLSARLFQRQLPGDGGELKFVHGSWELAKTVEGSDQSSRGWSSVCKIWEADQPRKEGRHASPLPEFFSQNPRCWQRPSVHMHMTKVYVLDAETHYFIVRVGTGNSVPQIVKNNARCGINKSS